MEWIEANAGWLWLVLAAGLAGVELLTLDLVFLMIAAGAGAAGVVALVGGPPALQLAAFAAVALLMLAAVRPVALRHLRQDTGAGASYLDTLPGRRVAAQGAITGDAGTLAVDAERQAVEEGVGSGIGPGEHAERRDDESPADGPARRHAGNLVANDQPCPSPDEADGQEGDKVFRRQQAFRAGRSAHRFAIAPESARASSSRVFQAVTKRAASAPQS